jgi:hypothetical protein
VRHERRHTTSKFYRPPNIDVVHTLQQLWPISTHDSQSPLDNWQTAIEVPKHGNISSGNQHLRANYENFNPNHTILIQGRTHERWEGWFAKFMGGGRDDLQRCFCKLLLPPPLSAPLDQHHVAQIEVSIVFTERSVSTWYVAPKHRRGAQALRVLLIILFYNSHSK